MKILVLFFIAVLFTTVAFGQEPAAEYRLESDYVSKWCVGDGYEVEKRLKDGTRVDCQITNPITSWSVEADFSNKWAESIIQALFYAHQTDSKPAILLIDKGNYGAHQKRLRTVLDNYVKVEVVVICVNEDAVQYECVY